MTYHKPHNPDRTPDSIRENWLNNERLFGDSVFRGARKNDRFSRKMGHFLNGLIDEVPNCSRLIASNTKFRTWASDLLVDAMLLQEQRIPKEGSLYHVTIVNPEDFTGDRVTEIDWAKIRKRCATVMNDLGPNFLGMGEVQATVNRQHKDGDVDCGRILSPHYHILLWTTEKINCRKKGAQLSKRFPEDEGGVTPVRIVEFEKGKDDVCALARYILKSPYKCKTLYQKNEYDADGSVVKTHKNQHESPKGYTAVLHRRLAEINSLVELPDLMISGGEGVKLKNKLIGALKAIADVYRTDEGEDYSDERIEDFWRAVKKRSATKHYEPPVVRTKASQSPRGPELFL